MTALRRLVRDTSGAIAVEFAIIGPVFLLALLGMIEYGRLLWYENALHYAVEEAARCMSIATATCSDATTTKSFASTRSGHTFATSVFTITTPSCGNQVAASYNFTFASGLLGSGITLRASSCFPS